MGNGILDSSVDKQHILFDEDTLARLCGDRETARRFFDPVKSDYQLALEAKGWEFVGNEIVTNYHIGLDLEIEPHKNSLRRMMDDYKTRLYPNKQVGFFRAHNTSSERLPPTEFFEFFGVHVRAVAIYVRDKEQDSSESQV